MYKKVEKKTTKATPAKKQLKAELRTSANAKAAKATPSVTSSKAGKNTTPKAAKPSAPSATPTFADIQLRAYFVAEKRQAEGRPGSSHGDWLEAERQLLAERSAIPTKKRRARAIA